VKRRKALKQLGVGLTAGLVLPSWLSACASDENLPEINYDGVIGIIGAGAAGLIAADVLLAKGVRVKIFEAHPRLGGRICSLQRTDAPTDSLVFFPSSYPYSDFPIELGPDRINGSNSKWANLLSIRGVPTVDFRAASTDRYVVGNQVKTAGEAGADAGFTAAKNFFDSFASFTGPAGLSVQQAAINAGVPADRLNLINSWLAHPYGAAADAIGARALAENMALVTHNGIELTLRNNPMQNALLNVFSRVVPHIRFNTPVQQVNYSGETIELVHANGTETVNKLIVTAPLAVLKAGDIAFSPALPASKLNAMSRLGMSAAMRIILEFKRNFYGEDVAAIVGSNEAPIILNAGVGRSTLNKTLSITVFGDKAAAYSSMNPDDVVASILAEMDSWFGGDASENIRTSLIPADNNRMVYTLKDWYKDPFIKGGISYHLPGGSLADREVLSAPVANKVFFAGEATDFTGEAGTVSGALKSGERAAFEVIDAILNG
jgi:monoamine oxidase